MSDMVGLVIKYRYKVVHLIPCSPKTDKEGKMPLMVGTIVTRYETNISKIDSIKRQTRPCAAYQDECMKNDVCIGIVTSCDKLGIFVHWIQSCSYHPFNSVWASTRSYECEPDDLWEIGQIH